MHSSKQREYRVVPMHKIIIDTTENARVSLVDIDKLEQDIRANGLIHPPTLVEDDEGNYRVVAGFRRATALRQMGTKEIPAMVAPSNLSPLDAALIQFNENHNRVDFTLYEKACALKKLEDGGLSRADIEKRTGLHQSTLSNYLGVFHLPEEVQEMVKDKPDELGIHHVRFLHSQLKWSDEDAIIKMAREVCGKTQADLEVYREKVRTKLGLNENDAARDGTTTPQAAEETKPRKTSKRRTTQIDTPDVEVSAPDRDSNDGDLRTASSIRVEIQRLNQKGAELDQGSPDYWKIIGAIEALQWALGDEPPLFEDMER